MQLLSGIMRFLSVRLGGMGAYASGGWTQCVARAKNGSSNHGISYLARRRLSVDRNESCPRAAGETRCAR